MARLTEAQRAQLDALRRSYRAELPAKLRLVGEAAATLRAGGWKTADLQALYELVHKLAGSAAIYGFSRISRAAGDVETWLLPALDADVPEERRAELPALVAAVEQAFEASGTAGAGKAVARRAPGRVTRRGSASR